MKSEETFVEVLVSKVHNKNSEILNYLSEWDILHSLKWDWGFIQNSQRKMKLKVSSFNILEDFRKKLTIFFSLKNKQVLLKKKLL